MADAIQEGGAVIAKLSESEVAQQITGWLFTRGWKCLRIQSGTFLSLDGKRHVHIGEKHHPDWIATRGREVLMIEIKAPGKRPNEGQCGWIDKADERGTPAMWADSLDMRISLGQILPVSSKCMLRPAASPRTAPPLRPLMHRWAA